MAMAAVCRGRPLAARGRTKIVVCDWDHDGRPDVLCSPPIAKNGGHQFFLGNQGLQGDKLVMKPEAKRIILDNLNFPPFTHYNMCEPVDFDGDGVWEVLAGSTGGTSTIGSSETR
ncbi:MAG: hypothetical protein Ct9H300mP1_12880 [Planctomycetaceae bacterium]|nr:MAG: hypothetical protein Ct9H300mP1_12880 [Planctomycetaceae bacterium]